MGRVAQKSSHHDLWSVPFVVTISLVFQIAGTVFV